ncbi:hypothetical protein FB567DRAFT_595839 [Paraphoma chrysanthemicola]|uniref:SMP-LTD domain-containing protein n=1 Tax=Paraphoma chrysanthemicola TaxID=798071 RepID=A0A8K0QZ25_9PLEO|nr:hypothetical protein FB567DRAFT_595839 [Paraphoma chrysanthemicola]
MSGDWGYGAVFKVFVWGYLIGGLTFIPTALVLAWFWFTRRVDPDSVEPPRADDLADQRRTSNDPTTARDEDASLGIGLDEEILRKLKKRTDVPDTFAGYFAVCREYVPGGVNGKPPDRMTPAGAIVSTESPSVYQSMYRSIFDRNKTTSPSIDAPNARTKKARNVFYVVLRLGHLMLYDNEDQLEVRHHISLAHYQTDIYAGGDRIPEGELWIKRNCIRLVQKHDGDTYDDAKSFYLFSDNCSEKEDFYHAMLQAQEHHEDSNTRHAHPAPLKFDTPDLVKLVQQLHASEENMHTRWINALIGRVFLGLYKTAEVKNFIAAKITKKIARVPKPALISSVALRSIDMGTLPPFLTNPKLKELTVDGDLVVEADISYKGNFRIEIAAIARIELGTRFKAREVTLVLAAILKKLDGHILIRIKPPPSNRLWITFELPPRLELSLEPIVSSRQITYGVILRAIESRIREVVNETLVLPNWDDMPFTDTLAQAVRGGIWQNNAQSKEDDARKAEETDVFLENATIDAAKLDEKADAASHMSIPSSIDSEDSATAISSATDLRTSAARPRTMRSTSSAAPAQLDSANASAELIRDHGNLTPTSVRSLPLNSPIRSPLQPEKAHSIAAFASTSDEDVSTQSQSDSPPLQTGDGSHSRAKSRELTAEDIAAAAAAAAAASNSQPNKKTMFNQSLNTATAAARNWLVSKQNAQAARKTAHQRTTSTDARPTTAEDQHADGETHPDTPTRPELNSSISKSHTEPMGRGQPLPPPGTPLPPPTRPEKRQTWAIPAAASTFANIAKRKPVTHAPAHPSLSEKRSTEHLQPPTPSSSSLPHSPLPSDLILDNYPTHDMPHRKPSNASHEERQVPRRKSSATSSTSSIAPPPLPKRRQRQQSLNLSGRDRRHSQISQGGDAADSGEGLFVVEAPVAEGGVPGTPVDEVPRAEGGSGKGSVRSDSGSGERGGLEIERKTEELGK